MDKEKLKEAMKWYKRKIAIILGINIDDINDNKCRNIIENITELKEDYYDLFKKTIEIEETKEINYNLYTNFFKYKVI